MARSLRFERGGAWHHVTARGNERRAIYRDDRDREHFIQLLAETVEVFAWRLHAYVLMGNHFHLMVETPEPNLGRGMHWLNVSYSVWFNRRHQRTGHLFQGRFASIAVDPVAWGLALSRYVHLNPVRVESLGLDKAARHSDRAGMGEKPDMATVKMRVSQLRAYRWSSYRAYLGLVKAPAWLERATILELGGKSSEAAAMNYRRYVESAVRQGLEESPWESLRARTILGGAEFLRQMEKTMQGNDAKRRVARRLTRPSVRELIGAVEEVKGEKWEAFRDRHGDWGRDLVFYLGRKDWAVKLRELGEVADGMTEIAVSLAAKRFASKVEKSRAIAAALQRCREKLQGKC